MMGKNSISISSAEIRDLLIQSMEDVYTVFSQINDVYSRQKSELDTELMIKRIDSTIASLSRVKESISPK